MYQFYVHTGCRGLLHAIPSPLAGGVPTHTGLETLMHAAYPAQLEHLIVSARGLTPRYPPPPPNLILVFASATRTQFPHFGVWLITLDYLGAHSWCMS